MGLGSALLSTGIATPSQLVYVAFCHYASTLLHGLRFDFPVLVHEYEPYIFKIVQRLTTDFCKCWDTKWRLHEYVANFM